MKIMIISFNYHKTALLLKSRKCLIPEVLSTRLILCSCYKKFHFVRNYVKNFPVLQAC